MKFLVFFVLVGAVAALSDAEHVHHHQRRGVEEKTAAITDQQQNLDPEGNFQYSYNTANGISARALGTPKAVGVEKPVVIEGTYSYTSPDGKTVNVKYTADENGYRPSVQL